MNTAADRPRAKSLSPLRALLPFLRPYRGLAAAALGSLLVATGAMLALPVALRRVIDVLDAKDAAATNRMFIGLFAAAAILGIFGALRFYFVSRLGERVVADVREAVYRRVIRMDPMFFETTRVGEVLSRLTADTTLIQAMSGANLSIILRSSLTAIGALVLLVLTSAKLAGIILLFIPVVVAPLIIIGRRVRSLSRTSQDKIADSSGLAGETLNAIQTVQAFTLEKLQTERYSDAVEASYSAALRRIKVRALLTAVGIMLVFAAIVAVLWLGAHDVLAGTMSGGELGQFLTRRKALGPPLFDLGDRTGLQLVCADFDDHGSVSPACRKD